MPLADLDDVKEVTLHATADLSLWEAVLHKEGLLSYQDAGKYLQILAQNGIRGLYSVLNVDAVT